MKLKVQLVSVIDGHEEMREVADLEREMLEPETLGLTLAEGKGILKGYRRRLPACPAQTGSLRSHRR